ncbi:Toprim domain-containing protein [Hephaestia caeni]|uniref:Toprim domain-containing protein n=1 Tax=Hephaestia caeni TaxID=645617 RepID=A0A397PCP2_9SPHN|nr:toprim domain-containing protein [Hephaestia caeni]RIA46738.1 Toprim domain-containing protein [Hephaestia caeni]
MHTPASQMAAALADQAEAVCRRYLSNGRKEGRYWLVGDVHNAAGRSLYVRLVASPDGRGLAGKWTDAQNGDHGDLLDIIAASCGHRALRDTLDEARRFLSLPQPPPSVTPPPRRSKAPTGTPEAARRLFAASQPIAGTIAAVHLASRGITDLTGCDALRFHPRCWYRPSVDDDPDVRKAWPAMIAAVTDLDGTVTGVHRTWLTRDGAAKAPIAYPRRAMGHLLGNGVRFGASGPVMLAAEGIETLLSLRQVMPTLPAIAGLSAAHLAAILFPAGLRRLYVARDDDPAGATAFTTLVQRALPVGIEVMPLDPRLDDFNGDLVSFGRRRIVESVSAQLWPEDAAQFLEADNGPGRSPRIGRQRQSP